MYIIPDRYCHLKFMCLQVATFVSLILIMEYCSGVTVWTRSYDNSRSNANLNETTLTTRNVNPKEFGKLFSRKIVGHVYAQVLYVPSLRMKSTGKTHNVVFVATMANYLYAFDADDPKRKDPLWVGQYGPSLPIDEQQYWWGSSHHCSVYTDIQIEVGILSTPVIDTTSNTIFFVSVNKDSHNPYTVRHRLHAVDIQSGEEKPLSPVIIAATVPGTGVDSVNGTVTFGSAKQSQRHALSLVDGVVYFGFGSYCSANPYHGWLFGYKAATLERVLYFCSTPNGEQGAIWHTGQGLVSDSEGYLYIISTNGYFKEGTDFANSFMKLDPRKVQKSGIFKGFLGPDGVVSHFTPYNWQDLYIYDLDLGTSGPMMIPGSEIVFCCSKFGWCYLVDKDNMGGFDPIENKNLQYYQANKNYVKDPNQYPHFRMGVHTSPTTWYTPRKGRMIYIWPAADQLKAYHFVPSGRLGRVDLTKTETGTIGLGTAADPEVLFPGGTLSLSANGDIEGTGVLWASHPVDGSANRMVRSGILRAFDASDITKELWNSAQVPCRDRIGFYSKFTPPTIANGKVYIPSFSPPPNRNTELHIYGIMSARQQQAIYEFDICCIADGCIHSNTSCCNGACYNPSVHTCSNKQLCPVGTKSCKGACYSPLLFTCQEGTLVPGPEPESSPLEPSDFEEPIESTDAISSPEVTGTIAQSFLDLSYSEPFQPRVSSASFCDQVLFSTVIGILVGLLLTQLL